MHFQKNSVHARGASRARQRLDEFRLAAAGLSLPARQLHRMRHVENHRAAGLAPGSETSACPPPDFGSRTTRRARSEEYLLVPGALHFLHGVGHFPRRKKLSLFQIHHAPRLPRGHQQIGLPRKKRRNLQHVADLRRGAPPAQAREYRSGCGTPNRSLIFRSTASPASSPGPR